MKKRVRINKEKLEEAKEQLKPKTTWLALLGIIFFFFVPEVVAFFWGAELKTYFLHIASLQDSTVMKKLYEETADMISENSILNIAIGFGFVYWWYHERRKSSK